MVKKPIIQVILVVASCLYATITTDAFIIKNPSFYASSSSSFKCTNDVLNSRGIYTSSSSSSSSSSLLYMSSNNSDDGNYYRRNDDLDKEYREYVKAMEIDKRKEKERMDIIRSLQNSFYMSTSTDSNNIDKDGNNGLLLEPPTIENGGIMKIPIWNVQWTELPGRTNVLSIKEPIYTNMFEEIIRNQHITTTNNINATNWYFGHIGNSKIKKINTNIQTWKECINNNYNNNNNENKNDSTTNTNSNNNCNNVLGTLMKITDYRRMEDGKLLLLVQAIDRFIITEKIRTVPYAIAKVQLLPDREEIINLPRLSIRAAVSSTTTSKIDNDNNNNKDNVQNSSSSSNDDSDTSNNNNINDNDIYYTEDIVQPVRTDAIMNSWEYWYLYEYDSTLSFPLPKINNMPITDVVGSALAKVLPYAPYDTTKLPTEQLLKPPKLITTTSQDKQDKEEIKAEEKNMDNQSTSSSSKMTTYADWVEDETTTIITTSVGDNNTTTTSTTTNTEKALEIQLLENNILKEFSDVIPMSYMTQSINELEMNLWLSINDFLISTRTPVSPILLGLLPPSISTWSKKQKRKQNANTDNNTSNNNNTNNNAFLLDRIANTIEYTTTYEHNYVRVSTLYPNIKRQKRLSYNVAKLLFEQYYYKNDTNKIKQLRTELLQIPSTKMRLAYVLWKFDLEQSTTFQ